MGLITGVTTWAILAIFTFSADAAAQGFLRPMSGAQPGRFIEPPRAIEQQLKDAERALLDERYSDAVVVLGDLLARDVQQFDESDLSGQDFFLGTEDLRVGAWRRPACCVRPAK